MRLSTVAVCLGLSVLVGCNHLPWVHEQARNEGLAVSGGPPTAASVVAALNDNARKVQTLECRDVELDCKQGNDGVGLQALLVCQPKQRNFCMRGKALGSSEVDLGSNSQEFWFWIKRSQPPYLYHCSHEDFARGAARMPFPFQPDWIIEGLGIAEYDPSKNYELVAYRDGATYDLVEQTTSPQGIPVRKVTRLKGRPGNLQVTAHILQDNKRQDICGAYITEAQQDPGSGAVLPRRVVLVWPAEKIQMKMTLDRLMVNEPIEAQRTAVLFTRPSMEGFPGYDLARGPDSSPTGLRRTGGVYR